MRIICGNNDKLTAIGIASDDVVVSYNNTNTSIMVTAMTEYRNDCSVVFSEYHLLEKNFVEFDEDDYKMKWLQVDDCIMTTLKSILTVQYFYQNNNVNYHLYIPHNIFTDVSNVHIKDVLGRLDLSKITQYQAKTFNGFNTSGVNRTIKSSIYPIF